MSTSSSVLRKGLRVSGGLTCRAYSRSAGNFAGKRQHRDVLVKMQATSDEHEARAKELGLPFRTISAGILHRYPEVSPDAPEWDVAFQQVQDKINAKKREMFNSEMENTDADVLSDVSMDYDEILKSMPFQPASRITEADEKNDRHSPQRRLTDSLFLLVKRNRSDKSWQFPQGKLRDEETLRDTAERVTDRAVGKVERWFVGNAPVGHYVYAYPKEMQKARGEYGAKVFYYRSQLTAGNIKLETRLYTDFAWVARDEVGDYLDEETAYYMSQLLAD